eukprot:5501851-Amphidinium_carterae.1
MLSNRSHNDIDMVNCLHTKGFNFWRSAWHPGDEATPCYKMRLRTSRSAFPTEPREESSEFHMLRLMERSKSLWLT